MSNKFIANRHICSSITRLYPQSPELIGSSYSIFHFSILVDKFYSRTLKISILLSCWKTGPDWEKQTTTLKLVTQK